MSSINTPTPRLLAGKKGLIMGITNERSLAYGIARMAGEAGAELAFTYFNEDLKRRVDPIADDIGATQTFVCDANNDDQLARTMDELGRTWGGLDFIVHSIAFAHKDELRGGITNTTREGFRIALETSCYSFIATARAALPHLNAGASLLTLSYLGGERVVPNYNVMGVAKAALESATRYLAAELGTHGARVNAISAGPVNTLAARGIGGFSDMLKHHEATAPLGRLTTQDDVAGAALYLLSPLSGGVTGEIHYVDGGANILGPTPL